MRKILFALMLLLMFPCFLLAQVKISELPESTELTLDDLLVVVDSPASSPVTKKITIANAYKIKVLSLDTSCTIGSDCDSTSVAVAYGGIVLATAAITITLPEIVASPSATQVGIGASLCVIARDAAEALIVDPNANDSITLDGTKDTAGHNITATGAGAFVCLVAVEADNWMVLGKSGTWSAE